MRVVYRKIPWADDLAEYCRDLAGVELVGVDSTEQAIAAAQTADALIIGMTDYTAELADLVGTPACPVRWIQFLSAGFETADQHGVAPGVALTNGSPAWAPVVAEHAVAMLLACMRQIPAIERLRTIGSWNRAALLPHLQSLEGAQVGLLGVGAIGREIAARLRPFGAQVVAFVRRPRPADGLAAMHPIDQLSALLPNLDAVISSLPLTEATRGMFGAALLGRMKPTAILVNVGRGPTIDEAALVAQLKAGGLAAAALDVFAEEPLPAGHALWTLPNVILSPHVAGFGSAAGTRRLAELCRANIVRFGAGQPLLQEVEPVRRG